MLIRIRGVVYPTVKAAAEANNVTIAAVYSALHRGDTDTIGMGKNFKRPITLDGVTFRSIAAASKELGLGRTYLWKVLNHGTDYTRQRVADALAAYKEKNKGTT